MKILLIIHEKFDPDSGSAGSTFKIGEEYRKLGHDVQYYSFDDLPQKLPRLAKRVTFPAFVAAQIQSIVRRQQIDVVDASTGDAWVWAKLFRQSRHRPPLLVTRSHGLEHMKHLADLEEARKGSLKLSWVYPLYRGSAKLWEVSASLRCADLVYLLNHQEEKYVIEQLGVSSERTHVFPNGIPDYLLNLPFEPIPDAEAATIRIAQVSTYIPRKGILYSIPALNRILARYPQVEISFFGTQCRACPDPAQVYADFDPAVRDRVKVIPRYQHETLPNLLSGHHIKLLPSISEGFGKALVEAMACGLAPITTATPGPLEVVSRGHDGIIIPTRDTEAIEQALEHLITHRSYLEQLRRNAYLTAQRYSWRQIAENRLKTYETALALDTQESHPSKTSFNGHNGGE
ncbi:MAG: glycosyltransferase family 4 protein [Microcoleaceae cyanobacterium]